ncbi:MAG: EF2563 family selenium-dependent molybdenum hydroxylase system protein [Chloroflexota bacterium]|nr:MAG: EF2563 family selenium-dependent molybdenum hydroxylase system protein [Chloroflexota bacterium]
MASESPARISLENTLVVVRGAGDLATGAVYRLFRSGFPVVATEVPQPLVVRRSVSFAEAIFTGRVEVEGLVSTRADRLAQVWPTIRAGQVPILVDPDGEVIRELRPTVVVDAIMAKRNLGTRIDMAPVVIALGPGFTAGEDAHAVIETNRGHNLGRVILSGEAEPDTGIPGEVGGRLGERVLHAPTDGTLEVLTPIGSQVKTGELLARVNGQPVLAPFDGILRGMLKEGLNVFKGLKIGDIDPRCAREHCFTISDKALAVGGGVLEASLYLLRAQARTLGESTAI